MTTPLNVAVGAFRVQRNSRGGILIWSEHRVDLYPLAATLAEEVQRLRDENAELARSRGVLRDGLVNLAAEVARILESTPVTYVGTEEGAQCLRLLDNFDTCNGVIEFSRSVNCSCHLGGAPCHSCESVEPHCPVCRWHASDVPAAPVETAADRALARGDEMEAQNLGWLAGEVTVTP